MISRIYRLAFGMVAALAATERLSVADPILTHDDVNAIVGQALRAAAGYGVTNGYIAVSDREGYMLGLYSIAGGAPAGTDFGPVNAIDKAGTAAYLSSNAEAFTSRTAGFIIQPHFPPGIMNTGTGPLTGVGLSSLPFSDVNHFRAPGNPARQALPILNTSLSGNPGGVPLYKGGVLVGGVGVDTKTTLSALVFEAESDIDENIAVTAQSGFGPPAGILATQVLINGLRLPYTSFNGSSLGTIAPDPTHFLDPLNFAVQLAPTDSPGAPFNPLSPNPFPDIPGGQVRNKIIDSPVLTTSLVSGQLRLSAGEVTQILHQGAIRASQTRGAIRNPIGAAQVFIVVIDYYNPTGNPPGTTIPVGPGPPPVPLTSVPQVLGSFRTPDATIFSYDVAAQKARTSLFFSNNTMALSSRGVGFLAQGTYPPGIDGTANGPYGPPTYGPSDPRFGVVAGVPLFPLPYGIQTAVSLLPFGGIPATPINPYLPNGITVFPGGFPLYRNGVLIGAVGVSGDGVDQDDIIAASATVGFEAPTAIRSDEFAFRGARLPYAKFPQNSSL